MSGTGRQLFCPNCGSIGTMKTITPGSFWMELGLWMLMLAPGLIYSLWRLGQRRRGCARCGYANMVPIDSPVAREAIARQQGVATG